MSGSLGVGSGPKPGASAPAGGKAQGDDKKSGPKPAEFAKNIGETLNKNEDHKTKQQKSIFGFSGSA